jgi:UDP-glucose 4-epimerase
LYLDGFISVIRVIRGLIPQGTGNRQDPKLCRGHDMSRLIVVGKHGYIASALCRWFDQRRIPYTAMSSSDCDLEQAAVAADRFGQFDREEIQVLFTAAINPWLDNSPYSYDKNLRMVGNFVRATERVKIRHLIYLSSVDVYGSSPRLPLTEETPPRADSWYGRAKTECEQIVRLCEDRGAAVTILRLPGVYGPSDNDRSVVGKLVRDIRDNHEVTIHGNGTARRDYVFIDDLCAIITRLLETRPRGTWNVATGVSLSIREISLIIGEAVGTDFRTIEGRAKPGRDFDLLFDNSELLSTVPGLGFTPFHYGLQAYLAIDKQKEICCRNTKWNHPDNQRSPSSC